MSDSETDAPQRFGWTVIPPIVIISFFLGLLVWTTVESYSDPSHGTIRHCRLPHQIVAS